MQQTRDKIDTIEEEKQRIENEIQVANAKITEIEAQVKKIPSDMNPYFISKLESLRRDKELLNTGLIKLQETLIFLLAEYNIKESSNGEKIIS